MGVTKNPFFRNREIFGMKDGIIDIRAVFRCLENRSRTPGVVMFVIISGFSRCVERLMDGKKERLFVFIGRKENRLGGFHDSLWDLWG